MWRNNKRYCSRSRKNTTTCQLYLRAFKSGDEISIEPFRASAFPILKNLKVDRSAFDRIVASCGYISVDIGQAPKANSILIPHQIAENAFSAAACIGCGAYVAICKNASAALFSAAKVSHLAKLPQGIVERKERVLNMVVQMDFEGFGNCTNTEACKVECPQNIDVLNIARMNYKFLQSKLK